MNKLVAELLSTAQQARASCFRDHGHISSFLQGHAETVKLLEELQPGADSAALLALHLIVFQETAWLPIEEEANLSHFEKLHLSMSSSNFAMASACLPAPSSKLCGRKRESRHSFPGMSSARLGQPPSTLASQVSASPSQSHYHAQKRGRGKREPRKSKYTVINPRTGEQLVISSVVPFSWRHSRRLRILDPRTGEEVLPCRQLEGEHVGQSERMAGLQRARSTSCSQRARSSTCSSISASSERSATPSTRRLLSLAGGAVKEGSAWVLEPASGGHWDWPLSRQEKKDRILVLSQLELISELEDLQAKEDVASEAHPYLATMD